MGRFLKSVRSSYRVNASGTFGMPRPGGSRKRVVAIIKRRNPTRSARALFRLAKLHGATIDQFVDEHGNATYTAFFTKDSKVTFRPTSSSDSTPTITIDQVRPLSGIAAYQHLHFEKDDS